MARWYKYYTEQYLTGFKHSFKLIGQIMLHKNSRDLAMSTHNNPAPNLTIQYEEKNVFFASQFLATTAADEMILNFSSGFVQNPANGQTMLPIQHRIAMTRNGALRLLEVLQKALATQEQAGPNTDTQSRNIQMPQASLPDYGSSN